MGEKYDVGRKGPMHVEARVNILHWWDQLADVARDAAGYDVADHLPGPLSDVGTRYPSKLEVIRELAEWGVEGKAHLKWTELQRRFCGGSGTANFVVPMVSFTAANGPPPQITNLVIISHPADAARLARRHVKKMPDQGLFLGEAGGTGHPHLLISLPSQ